MQVFPDVFNINLTETTSPRVVWLTNKYIKTRWRPCLRHVPFQLQLASNRRLPRVGRQRHRDIPHLRSDRQLFGTLFQFFLRPTQRPIYHFDALRASVHFLEYHRPRQSPTRAGRPVLPRIHDRADTGLVQQYCHVLCRWRTRLAVAGFRDDGCRIIGLFEYHDWIGSTTRQPCRTKCGYPCATTLHDLDGSVVVSYHTELSTTSLLQFYWVLWLHRISVPLLCFDAEFFIAIVYTSIFRHHRLIAFINNDIKSSKLEDLVLTVGILKSDAT